MASSPNQPVTDPAREAATLMDAAETNLAGGRFEVAAALAQRAVMLEADPARALPLLARAREAHGDLEAAFHAFSKAMAAVPADPAISGEVGRLALRLGKYAAAELALTAHVGQAPSVQAIADLARAQAGLKAFDRAQATLQGALQADPSQPKLWLALAGLLCAQGGHAQAIVFFEEALRLDIADAGALDGIAEALLLAGDPARALEASEEALAQAAAKDRPALSARHARRLLAVGQLPAGWAAYAEQIWPGEAASVIVKVAAPRLGPETAVDGRLLLIGEADVADELLLAQTLPRLLAGGAQAIVAVHPGWAALAERSFPEAVVVARKARTEGTRHLVTADLDSPHVHAGGLIGAWAPLSALPALYAVTPSDFAEAKPYLRADEARVAHWRLRLAGLGLGPKIGLLWHAHDPTRPWEAPPLPALAAALDAPGVNLIGLQSEDYDGELAWIRENLGFPIMAPPPELNLSDLDDVAAFVLALDATVGPPDTASILAAACGAQTWFLSPPRHWMRLGSPTYPWFPWARVLACEDPSDWTAPVQALHEAVCGLAAGKT